MEQQQQEDEDADQMEMRCIQVLPLPAHAPQEPEEGKAEIENEVPLNQVSAVEFDSSGDFLAVGDHGGAICIFRMQEGDTDGLIEYQPCITFQSHVREFDCLKSVEYQAKVKQIAWCNHLTSARFLFSASEKTVKLWKLHDKRVNLTEDMNLLEPPAAGAESSAEASPVELRIPRITKQSATPTATQKRVYANAHEYSINSVSVVSDGETFLSSDDLRINMWNMEHTHSSFVVLDLKPDNMEELQEVVTSVRCHPQHCHSFAFGDSRGNVRVCDLRESAVCARAQHTFSAHPPQQPGGVASVAGGAGGGGAGGGGSFFDEVISSVLDLSYTPDGRYLVARDYACLRVYDTAMSGRGPVTTIAVHEHMRPLFGTLLENESIFDSFECSVSGDGSSVLTGSYNDFHICDLHFPQTDMEPMYDLAGLELSKKVQHHAWHPKLNIIAVASQSSMYLYST